MCSAALNEGVFDVDDRSLVSRADLNYRRPTRMSLEGQPLGNGTMGTLIWTTPSQIHLQINRSDVFAANHTHTGPQYGSTDYCNGCAAITIDAGSPAFAQRDGFEQRLSLYDAECLIDGDGLVVRGFISSAHDMLVLEIDDRRPNPQALAVTVFMWRPPMVATGDHLAQYTFETAPGQVTVAQRFSEHDYACTSAVAVRANGHTGQPAEDGPYARVLTLPPARGKRTVFIASAATGVPAECMSQDVDVARMAEDLIDRSAQQPLEALVAEHRQWWHSFWQRSFVHLTSTDGLADFVACVRTLFLYYMACTSRGPLPPKFNGMLFSTDGDQRAWGSQFWLWNTELLYFPLFAANAIDLTDTYFRMYHRQLPAAQQASVQRWGSQGAFFPETAPFDGPVVLPDDVAAEFQSVILGRKSNTQLSQRARAAGGFESSLRVFTHRDELTAGRYTWISHITSSGAELAVQAWWRFRYTQDMTWLRDVAYPMLKATVEFYRHFVQQGPDGCYHTYPTNSHERFWGVRDNIMDLAAIRGTAPLALRAAELLDADADLRAGWTDLLAGLAPYPMGVEPASQALTGGALAGDAWAAGHLGDVPGSFNGEEVWMTPVFPFEHYTVASAGQPEWQTALRTFDVLPDQLKTLDGGISVVWSRMPIITARVSRGEELPTCLANLYAGQHCLPNGMSMCEGHQAHTVEHLASITAGIQDGLLQAVSPTPGVPEIIHICPAWPRAWDAAFKLLARGGFMVAAAIRQGRVDFIEIESSHGGTCRLRNPWPEGCVVEGSDGTRGEYTGEPVVFDTSAGGRYLIWPRDRKTRPDRISLAPANKPAAFTLTLNGKTLQGALGLER
ncbi:MAG: DUF5703 domain-containing protein [Chloroflexi bacterium]|nr:DUF5703 domain-containing protein [Chloroflexota bacterium]